MSKDSNVGYGLVMFLLGAAAGAAVALLYAPQAGEDTRKLISEKAGEARDKATEVTAGVTQTAKEKIGQFSDKASELINRGRQDVADAANKVADAAHSTADSLS